MRIFLTLLAALSLSACSSQYIMTTTDGTIIKTESEPELNSDTNMYEYEDSDGNLMTIDADKIEQVGERN
ncbi:YgdI/YgdR family lipoprotein [Vibrio sp.]|nr:YgdI/YgdR family lipoprotein [Vibrio sp.]